MKYYTQKPVSIFKKNFGFTIGRILVCFSLTDLCIEDTYSNRIFLQIKLTFNELLFQLWNQAGFTIASLFLFHYQKGRRAARGGSITTDVNIYILYKEVVDISILHKSFERFWSSLELLRDYKSKKLIGIRKHNFESTKRTI